MRATVLARYCGGLLFGILVGSGVGFALRGEHRVSLAFATAAIAVLLLVPTQEGA